MLWAALGGGLFDARSGRGARQPGRSQAVQAARVAEVVIAWVSGSSTVNVRLAAAMVMIGTTFDAMPYQLATIREVTTLAALRGRASRVNSFGGAADSILRYLLHQAGVIPSGDHDPASRRENERVAALRSGGIQATLVKTRLWLHRRKRGPARAAGHHRPRHRLSAGRAGGPSRMAGRTATRRAVS